MIEAYYLAGEPEKASELCSSMSDQVLESCAFFLKHYEDAKDYFESCYNVFAVLVSVADEYGDTAMSSSIRERFNSLLE